MKILRPFICFLACAQPAFAVAPSLNMPQIPSHMQFQEPPKPHQNVPIPGVPLETNIIMQIAQCWVVPPVPNIQTISAPILNVTMDQAGNATAIALSDISTPEFQKNPDFRQLVMSAIVAVKSCTPLKALPAAEYEKWHFLQLKFDPMMMQDKNAPIAAPQAAPAEPRSEPQPGTVQPTEPPSLDLIPPPTTGH